MKEKFDLASEMLKNLEAKNVEEQTNAIKLGTAIDCLNKASDLLENLNDVKSAELLTKVIEKLAMRK